MRLTEEELEKLEEVNPGYAMRVLQESEMNGTQYHFVDVQASSDGVITVTADDEVFKQFDNAARFNEWLSDVEGGHVEDDNYDFLTE